MTPLRGFATELQRPGRCASRPICARTIFFHRRYGPA